MSVVRVATIGVVAAIGAACASQEAPEWPPPSPPYVAPLSDVVLNAVPDNEAPFDDAAPKDQIWSGPPNAPITGWRLESSLGVVVAIPGNYAVNDYGCGMSNAPTVVRAPGVQTGCLTPEASDKHVVEITMGDPRLLAPLAAKPTKVSGVDALRTHGRLADGRYLGWVRIPSLDVAVSVRVADAQTRKRILDSVTAVTTDHNGCATSRPASDRPDEQPGADDALAPASTNGATVCYYGTEKRLQASMRLSADNASALAALLNRAPAGTNADQDPSECTQPPGQLPVDVVLFLHGPTPRAIYGRFSDCNDRGFDNGERQAHVTLSLVQSVMQPLRVGFALGGDIPP